MIHSEGVENMRPLKAELERNSRGYNLSVSYRGADPDEVVGMVEETVRQMKILIQTLEEEENGS